MKKISGNTGSVFLVIISAMFWAGSGLGAQLFFVHSSENAMGLTAFRMIMAGILLFIICGWTGKIRPGFEKLRQSPKLFLHIFLYANAGLMLMAYTYFEAVHVGNAAAATVILYTSPAMVIVYHSLRYRRLPSKRDILTVCLAIGGTFLLVTGGDVSRLSVPLLCVELALFNGAIYAFSSIYPKHIFLQMDKTFVLALSMLLGGLSSWALDPGMHWSAFLAPDVRLNVFCIVVLGTVIAFLLYNMALMYISPQQALITAAAEPASSVIMSRLFLDMDFGGLQTVGILLVLTAIIVPAVMKK